METLGEWAKELEGTEPGALLAAAMSKASQLRGGRSFNHVEVVSREVMGHDGGDFNTLTEKTRISDTMLATREGINKVTEVLVHEDIHRGNEAVGDNGCHSEGLTQWQTLKLLGKANDSAYQEEVKHIQEIADTIGKEKVKELSKKEDAELLLWRTYTTVRVQKGASLGGAAKEGADHLKEAA